MQILMAHNNPLMIEGFVLFSKPHRDFVLTHTLEGLCH